MVAIRIIGTPLRSSFWRNAPRPSRRRHKTPRPSAKRKPPKPGSWRKRPEPGRKRGGNRCACQAALAGRGPSDGERLAKNSWQGEPVLPRAGDRIVIAGVGMTHHAARRIVPQHALDAPRRPGRPARDNDHARMWREADADAAAVMQRDPGRA